jgi:NAD+ synthase (glutamine-hydrolysing)
MQELLSKLRARRGFNVINHTWNKVTAINEFFREEGLDAAVIGLSGGIDSAVTLALLIEASKVEGSPIKKILGFNLPIYGNGGTGQDNASDRAVLLHDQYSHEFKYYEQDLTPAFNAYKYLYTYVSDFAAGQLLSIVRTPYLYFRAAILQDSGYKSIVVGTTNRDEGAFIGFYGKASDTTVDLQPIADLHKSEVYAIARYLNLPEAIIDEPPKGDVHDGRTDFEMIGATYDEVELFTLLQDYGWVKESDDFELSTAVSNIKKLNNQNIHKYKVGLPSRFVDVLPRGVIGGWK